jgi:hypothetical protein
LDGSVSNGADGLLDALKFVLDVPSQSLLKFWELATAVFSDQLIGFVTERHVYLPPV